MLNSTLLINHFPDQIKPSFNATEYSNQFQNRSFIIDAHAKEVDYANHWGILSIKCAFNGTEYYKSRNSMHAVTDKNYLVFNEGTFRSSYIMSRTPVHSFSISFSPRLVSSFFFSFHNTHENILDNPFNTGTGRIEFTEKLYEHDSMISPLLRKIMELCKDWSLNQNRIDEPLSYLLRAMTFNQKNVWNMMRQVRAMKPSTQKELYERIHRAKDYMSACYFENLTIERLAQVACLNPHYFLREFKKIMLITPHQFLQKIRLQEAQSLLEKTDKPVNEVCNLIGFSDVASFCKLFKKHYSQSPGNYRRIIQHSLAA